MSKPVNISAARTLCSLLLILSAALLISCRPKGAPENTSSNVNTRIFTDSAGREVEVPCSIEKIAVTGSSAQILVFALCPDKLVGLSDAWTLDAKSYIDARYYDLPVLGQLYGGRGDLNLETLLASGAQVVIDIGEPKDSVREDFDLLTQQTGIPFVHITSRISSLGEAYRMLGELLNMPEEAEVLADYCDKVYERTIDIASSVDKARLLYITGDRGLNVIAKGAYHSEVIDLLSDNLAVTGSLSDRGLGNEIDIEQLLNWNPDVILVSPDSIYDTIASDSLLQNVFAVKNGKYYKVPQGPYNWMGFPPSSQRLLGMMWMARLLYPEATDYDLQTEVTEFYKLFYHCELSAEQYNALVADSIGKQ